MIPWFLQFIRNCTTKRMMHTAKNMHQILDLALPAYDELFDDIELGGLVEKKGILYIWNDQNLKSRELEIKVRNELGVDQQVGNSKRNSRSRAKYKTYLPRRCLLSIRKTR